MHFFTLVVIGLLCLMFKSTRLAGVAGLTFLSLIHPLLFLALLITGSAIFYIYRKGLIHEFRLSKLPIRRN